MLAQSFAPLIDLVFPPRCPLCGEGIGTQNGLCAECWSTLELPAEPACAICQGAMEDMPGGGPDICLQCRHNPPPHDGITAATLYNDAARKLAISFKHGHRIGLAPMLARLIAARLPELEGEWLVVPVPLHRWRLWQRGFNQSALIASQLARQRGLTLIVDGLVRLRNTKSLSAGRLGRTERARMLAGAIVANPRDRALRGAQVLLVDDVVTSGATTDACIAALRAAGVRKVRIACFSRVPDGAD